MLSAILILAVFGAAAILARAYRRRVNGGASETAETKLERGKRLYESGEFDSAIRCFDEIIKMNPAAKNPDAHYHLGHALRMRGYLCDAIDEWVACSMEDPDGDIGREAYRQAQRWRAHQVVREKQECPQCGLLCRLIELKCPRCDIDLKRTIMPCGVCGRPMIREAQLCVHCLPDDIKVEVASGLDWPIVKTTAVDWEAQLIKSRLESADIACVLTGEKGSAIPLTLGHLGEINVRVPVSQAAEAIQLLQSDPPTDGADSAVAGVSPLVRPASIAPSPIRIRLLRGRGGE